MLTTWNDVLSHIDKTYPVFHRFRFSGNDHTPERPHGVLRLLSAICCGTYNTRHHTFVIRTPLAKDFTVDLALCTTLAAMHRRLTKAPVVIPTPRIGGCYLLDSRRVVRYLGDEAHFMRLHYTEPGRRGDVHPYVHKVPKELKSRLQSCRATRHTVLSADNTLDRTPPIDWLMSTNLAGNRDVYRPEVILVGHVTHSLQMLQTIEWVLTDGNLQHNESIPVLKCLQIARINESGECDYISSGQFGAPPVLLVAADLRAAANYLANHTNLKPLVIVEDKIAEKDTSAWNQLRDAEYRLIVLTDTITEYETAEWMRSQDLCLLELDKNVIGRILNSESSGFLIPDNGVFTEIRQQYWTIVHENVLPVYMPNSPLDSAFSAFTSIRREDLDAVDNSNELERSFYNILLPEAKRLCQQSQPERDESLTVARSLYSSLESAKQWFDDREVEAIEAVEKSFNQWFDEVTKCPPQKHAYITRAIFNTPHPCVLIFANKHEAEVAANKLGQVYCEEPQPEMQTLAQARAKLMLINCETTWNISNIEDLREQARQSTSNVEARKALGPPSPRYDNKPVKLGDGVFCTEIVEDAGNRRQWVYCATPSSIVSLGYVKSAVIVGWLGRKKTRALLDGRIAQETTVLLYPFETIWYHNATGKTYGRSLRRVAPKTIDKLLGFPLAHLLATDDTVEDKIVGTQGRNDTEPDEQRQRLQRYNMERKRSTLPASADEHVDAIHIEFADGSFLLVPRNREFILAPSAVRNSGPDISRMTTKHAEELLEDDTIVLKQGSDSDIIRQVADQILARQGKAHLREVAGRWKKSLRTFSNCHKRFGFWQVSRDDANELHQILIEHGVLVGLPTLQTWLVREQPIGPQDSSHLKIIADITGDAFLAAKLNEVADAVEAVRSAHREAGDDVSKSLLKQLHEEFAQVDFDDALQFEYPGLGVLNVLRIVGTDPCRVPYTSINKLQYPDFSCSP